MTRLRISDALRRPPRGPVHLVPFVAAGHPSTADTAAALPALADAGAACIEVGIPFSDPIADGPTIQAAYHDALAAGATLDKTFEMMAGVRGRVACPTLAMVSYSVVRRRGDRAFCEAAASAGFDGLLCPDLPPPEAEPFADVAASAGLEPVLLVAPTTPPARRDLIGRLSGGFVYYLSVAGTTGQRDSLPPELAAGVADMRDRTDRPICVGFGISRHEHLQQLAGVADGAIVGSAIVRAMSAADDPAQAAAEVARSLIGG